MSARPRLFLRGDGFAREYGFPVVVKPREGYGSLHLYIAKCKEEMGSAIAAIEKVWAGEPVDGLLSRLFELKEEQRRVRE